MLSLSSSAASPSTHTATSAPPRTSIPFISKADLIRNKLEIGRYRDLADVEELTALDDDLFPRL